MFQKIDSAIAKRMHFLEEMNARHRQEAAPRDVRLRQVPPDTGKFLALMAAIAPPEGAWIEIGTSGGYSALWLSLACREVGRKLTTFEILPEKAALAQETFRTAGVEDWVHLVHGDALDLVANYDKIAFCFLDAEKNIYAELYELLVPRLITGGLLIADNAISHAADLQPMIDHAQADPRVDALVLPIGKGELFCRKK